jgi:hypothetical protein
MGSRWILRRRRQDWNYGVWLLVLASAAAAMAQFAMALAGATCAVAFKASAIRFASTFVCLFWLAPWFVSKFAQKPEEQAK